MANRITIDPKTLVNWAPGVEYRIEVGEGIVKEVGNNRSPSPLEVQNIGTFSAGPSVATTSPANNTATSFSSTVILTYNRPFFAGTGNYYLYRDDVNTTTNTLIETIPSTDERITANGTAKTVTINLQGLIVPESTYFISADDGVLIDMFSLDSVEIADDSVFKYTPGPAAEIIASTPANNQPNTFVNSATIVYNRTLSDPTGNYYLNFESSGTVKTFAASSLSLSTTGTSSTISLSFGDEVLPEGEYFITNDQGVFKDQYTFPLLAVTDNTELKWNNTSISNMTTRRFRGDAPYAVFTSTTPQVIDIAPIDPNGDYTFTLSSPVGEFSSPDGGTDAGSYWTFTGTKAQINSLINSIVFTSYAANNDPSTYTYSLTKGGVTLVNKTKDLLGILLVLGTLGPTGKAFPRLELDVEGTNTIDETITLTANISTSTALSGVIVFKANNVEIATVPITTSGFATTVTTFSSTGSRFISASWPAGTLSDGFQYEPLDSFDNLINIDTAAVFSGTVALSAVNRPSLRIPIGPPVDLLAQLTENSTGTSTITFVDVVPQTTTTTYTSATILTITASGERWVEVDNVSTVKTGDWIKISGTMTTVGSITSNYQVSTVVGNRINFGARSEDDNLYYWYDPLKEALIAGVTVSFDPIIYNGTYTKVGYNRLSENNLSNVSIVNNSATYTTSFSSTGTKYIVADWSGTSTAPKYYPKSSELIAFEVSERADYNGSLVLNLSTGTVGQFETGAYAIQLSAPESTTGTVTLSLISTLGTSSYTTLVNTTTVLTKSIPTLESTVLSRTVYFGEAIKSTVSSTTRQATTTTSVSTASVTDQYFTSEGAITKTIASTSTTTVQISVAVTNLSEAGPYNGINRTSTIGIDNFYTANNKKYIEYQAPTNNSLGDRGRIFYANTASNWYEIRNVSNRVIYPYTGFSGLISTWTALLVLSEIVELESNSLTPKTVQSFSIPVNSRLLPRTGQIVTNYLNTSTVRTVTTQTFSRINTSVDVYVEESDFTAPFVNGTATIIVSSGTFNTTATVLGSNKLKAVWEGQTYTADLYYPYYAIESSTSTQLVTPVEITLAGTGTVSEAFNNTFTVSLNTSTAVAGTVSVYNGTEKILTVASNNNSATFTINSGTLSVGSNNLRAVWDATAPASYSNTLTVDCLDYSTVPIVLSGTTSEYVLYNNDNSTSTNTATIVVTAGHIQSNYNGALLNFITGDSRALNIGFGIGSTSALLYIDRNILSVGQSFSINGTPGYTITAISGTTPNVTVNFTPAVSEEAISANYPTVIPTGVVSLKDEILGTISTGTLTAFNASQSIATMNWIPSVAGQIIGARNLTVEFDGDAWYAPTIITTELSILQRTSPKIDFTASSALSGGTQFSIRSGADITLTASKPDGVAFINPIVFTNTLTNSTLATATFVTNTVTSVVQISKEGVYSIQCEYPGDAFATSTESDPIDITIFRSTFGNPYIATSGFGTSAFTVEYNFSLPWNVPYPTGRVNFYWRFFNGTFYSTGTGPSLGYALVSIPTVAVSELVIYIDRSILTVGEAIEIDGEAGYTITSIAPFSSSSSPFTVLGINPPYEGTRPAQMITGAFGETAVTSRTSYKVSVTADTSSFTGTGYYQVVAQYMGDDVWAPLITTGPSIRL